MVSTLRATAETFYRWRSDAGRVANKRPNFFKGTFAVLNARERRHFYFLIAADVLISVVDIVSLALLLWIVQFYLQPGESHLSGYVPKGMLSKGSVDLIAVLLLLFTIKNFAAFYISRVQNRFIGSVAVRLSKNGLVRYQASTFEEFVNVDSSVHLRKIAYQPYDFCQYMLSGVQQIITQSSLIWIAIAGILLFNAKLFLLLLLILLPPAVVVFYYIKKRLTKAKWHIKKGNERSFQYLMDALKGYVEGNIFERNDFFLRRFVNERKNFSVHLFDSISLQTLPSRLIEVFAVMGLFILIAIARWSGSADGQSLITIGAFMAAAYKIIPGMVKIVNIVSQIKAYDFALDELVAGSEETVKEGKEAEAIESISFDGIGFCYGDKLIFQNVSFDVKRGDFVGITGRSGMGKTSLLNVCLGFLEASEGTIRINGVAVGSEEIKKYWPQLAYVRQQQFFIHDSVARNVSFEEDGVDERKLSYVLNVVGLGGLAGKSFEVSDKIITENGKNISGGQQQRIALARALYKDAALILLDEPFNELDQASEFLLLEHFRDLAHKGKIVIMITHNNRALSFCNKIVSLDEQ
jgi:ABC-type multidrug transport system fused ATPase/permease subunit